MSGGVLTRPARMATTRVPALRVVSGEEEARYPKCSLWLRGSARALDIAAAWGLYVVGSKAGAGAVLAVLFLLLADGLLPAGQSVGKRLCGIRAVHLPTRMGVRYRESVLRNAPFGFIVLLSMMPAPVGPISFVGGVVVVGGLEAIRVLRDPHGQRLGDLWAETQVVDGKVVAGSMLSGAAAGEVRAPGRLMSAARRWSPAARRMGRNATCASR